MTDQPRFSPGPHDHWLAKLMDAVERHDQGFLDGLVVGYACSHDYVLRNKVETILKGKTIGKSLGEDL